MPGLIAEPAVDVCPFIDSQDSSCASHFRLNHLAEAFDICVSGFEGCSTFKRLMREQPEPLACLTVYGKPI